MLGDLNQKKIHISVPGGLAGQIFAVCYAAWIHDMRNMETHIHFFDVGTDISSFSVGPLLDTQVAHSMGISYSEHEGNLNWAESKSNRFLRFARKRFGKTAAWERARNAQAKLRITTISKGTATSSKRKMGTISRETLLYVSPGKKLIGYPVDYRVIEEAWPSVKLMLGESGRPDFSRETATDNSVAVHWRLGDYYGNPIHGSVCWESLELCISNAVSREVPVKIFTDSPELALQLVGEAAVKENIEFVSSDIWSDLFSMSRSKFFVGSHSGISFLVALAIRLDNPGATTLLPNRWFLDPLFDTNFLRPAKIFGDSLVYEVRFNEE